MKTILLPSLFVLLVILIPSIVFYFNLGENKPLSTDINNWGIYGDFNGGLLNPILTFITFITLLINLHIQIKENNENKKASLKNKFESIFFHQLNLLKELVNSFQVSKTEYSLTNGKEYTFIMSGREHLRELIDNELNDIISNNNSRDTSLDHQSYLIMYAENILNLCNLIQKESILSNDEKNYYFSILCLQLSSEEILFFYYWLLFTVNNELMNNLEEMDFFKFIIPVNKNALDNFFNEED